MVQDKRERNKLLSALLKISHGDLMKFWQESHTTADDDPGLYAHVIAWNHKNGRIRDSKIAFPVIALHTNAVENKDLAENAVAHLASLGPRELIKAWEFNKELKTKGYPVKHNRNSMFHDAIKKYLDVREGDIDWWTKAVIRNRKAMKALYTISNKKPAMFAQQILFDRVYPSGSAFDVIKNLSDMEGLEAASAILEHNIPITVASAKLGKKLDNPDTLIALFDKVSATELITASGQLKRLKSFDLPEVQSAYRDATKKASKDKKANVLKATRAAKATGMTKELAAIKEQSLKSIKNIEGDWVILADRSPSMGGAIPKARELAALLAKKVEGKVHLIFFDEAPLYKDVTGMTLDEIEQATANIYEGSSTSIGCGLRYLNDKKLSVDGIVIISDGEENCSPRFAAEYKKMLNEPAVYFIHMWGSGRWGYYGIDILSTAMTNADITYTKYDATKEFDYNSMVNVVGLLKPQVYGFLEEVMETPLLTLDKVFNQEGVEI